MLIKVPPAIKSQEIWATGTELATIMGKDRVNGKTVISYPLSKKLYVHTFKNPVLMTDNYRISKLSPTLRDTLFALYSSRPRIIEYCNVSTIWDNSYLGVWCPSIDTILFAKALNKVLKQRKNFKNAVEIGCGSGFLSKYALQKSNLKSILVNDLSPLAIKSAKDNINDKRASFSIGDGIKRIEGKKFDLIMCNPPYVPRPKSIGKNPYEGVGLLKHLVHNGQEYLNKNGIIVTNFSSLCRDIIFKEKPLMKLKLLVSMKVPLKVNNILNNKSWVKYLKKHGLRKDYHSGYEYWHQINIIMLEND